VYKIQSIKYIQLVDISLKIPNSLHSNFSNEKSIQ